MVPKPKALVGTVEADRTAARAPKAERVTTHGRNANHAVTPRRGEVTVTALGRSTRGEKAVDPNTAGVNTAVVNMGVANTAGAAVVVAANATVDGVAAAARARRGRVPIIPMSTPGTNR